MIDAATDNLTNAKDALKRLLGLLEQPEPGLMSWRMAVHEARAHVLVELRARPNP